jgi:hypothetical protein
MPNQLVVDLNRTIAINPEAAAEGASSKYLDVALQYIPSESGESSTTAGNEANDREWFSVLVGMNPGINNLGEVVDIAARKLIEQIKPKDVSMTVRLSNDVDKNGFCSKTVYFNWTKPECSEAKACSAS